MSVKELNLNEVPPPAARKVQFAPDVVEPSTRASQFFQTSSPFYVPREQGQSLSQGSKLSLQLRPLREDELPRLDFQCVLYQQPLEIDLFSSVRKFFEELSGTIWVPIREDDHWKVPFDEDWFASQAVNWVVHHRSSKSVIGAPDDLLTIKCSSVAKARLLAIPSFFKGIFYAIVDLVKWVFAKVFDKPNRELAFHKLKAQWDGVRLSGLAIFSPDRAKNKFIKEMLPEHFYEPRVYDVPVVDFGLSVPDEHQIFNEYPALL